MAQPPDELRPDLVPLIDLSPEDADAVCDAMANVGLEAVPYRLDPGASEARDREGAGAAVRAAQPGARRPGGGAQGAASTARPPMSAGDPARFRGAGLGADRGRVAGRGFRRAAGATHVRAAAGGFLERRRNPDRDRSAGALPAAGTRPRCRESAGR